MKPPVFFLHAVLTCLLMHGDWLIPASSQIVAPLRQIAVVVLVAQVQHQEMSPMIAPKTVTRSWIGSRI